MCTKYPSLYSEGKKIIINLLSDEYAHNVVKVRLISEVSHITIMEGSTS